MLLPLFFIGIAVAIGVIGVGKTIKAGIDASSAQEINDNANDLIHHSTKRIKNQRIACEQSLCQLGEEKQFVQNSSVKEFLDILSKIQNVDSEDLEGMVEIKKLHLDDEQFVESYLIPGQARNVVGGTILGAAGGALVAYVVYKVAQMLAHASTGTAIASLGGAAATNATLAFLGGGSIATGGLGIAGGTTVLGGLVVSPALLVMGILAGSAAKKNLERAYANRAEAIQIAERMDAASLQYETVQKRMDIFSHLSERLDDYFRPLINKIENILNTEGDDYSLYNDDSKKLIVSYISIAEMIKVVLDTSIPTDRGLLTEESEEGVVSAKK